jgi:hypothetical protein
MGPVQVLVVGLDRVAYSGEVLAELARLREAGIVRLVDLLLVSHNEDGTLDVLAPPPGLPTNTGWLATAILGRREQEFAGDEASLDSDADAPTWSLVDAVPVGMTAAVALLEHSWAAPLGDAIRRSGGTPLDETWLAREDLEQLERMLADARQN